ncbi:c6 zinc finger domain containing protein [Sporothrix brasiliensis 5110]|uniref:C6 zinc finger domain containing protein n=1 Tax=Sporothrix brasiliensis 5110 TaxID=1398154 RepID=A0A0C2FB64_9PEZI|nr:c6 zinc finger domain containing protein [Sporothrix brasiliensis 5110]KIH88308.1 c6 zinc finger domain containing protein [Sporothrix brasiliensis 5110]
MIADTVLVFPRSSTTTVPAALAAETLLRDDRMPVKVNGQWMFLSQDEMVELRKRNDIGTAVTTAPGTAGETKGDATTVTPTTKTTRTAASSPLPSFFDSSLASNFSNDSACPAFINSFLTNPTFKQCYPFSLLLQGSRSFFQAEKSLVSITQVLDATCAANATFCTSYLNRLATNLTDAANCGADYKLGNSIVVQAYDGMIGYQPLYAASCLTDPDTGAYCFANAITNLTTTANVYFYYLPLNSSLPTSGSEPSCNWCLKQTMAVYRSAAADRKKPIASTYLSAAQQVDTICGPAFVNDTLPAAIVSNAASLAKGPSLHWLAPALLISVAAYLI